MSSPPARIRSVRFKDGLSSAITGLGTNLDPRNTMRYAPSLMTQDMIDAAYRGSGMMRRVIDLPPFDMVREWRNWQAEQDQIKLLEAEERRLDLRGKVRLAETLRGLGGGAFILGLPGEPDTAAPATIRAKGLAYIHVVSRYQLTLGPIVEDHTDPAFGGPKHFTLTTTTGQKDIHPSRVVAFRGDAIPLLRMTGWEEQYWGESRVARVYDAVQNSDSAQGHFAALIGKVRNTIIGIPDLAGLLAEPDGDKVLQTRISAMILGESMFNATLRDAGDGTAGAGETIDHRQINWAGIPDIMMAFATFIGAVAGMPATLVIGKSPDGQNATGKGDADNWNATVRARQTLELGPCMDQVDNYLIPSAGVTPAANAEIWSEWAPLSVPSAKEQADTFFATMQAVEKVQATNAIPDEAFAKGFQNLMSEKGWIPGLEGALAELPEDIRFGITPDASNDDDPSAIQSEGGDPNLAGKGGTSGSDVPLRRAANDARFNDATPRTLYVQRKLLNAAEFIAWAKSQGFKTTTPADDLHVTITYSKTPVDWMKMGETWDGDKGELVVQPGGARIVEPLGDKGAVVLLFASSSISWRHEEMIRNGASHDFPEYQPHITITYDRPDGLDVKAVEPFRGALRFGPEIFEELNTDWKPGDGEK